MMKYLIEYSTETEGKALSIVAKGEAHSFNNFEEIEIKGGTTISLDLREFHKEPFKSEFIYELVKSKKPIIIQEHIHIRGLPNGENNDELWDEFYVAIISFKKELKGKEITEKKFIFPTSPKGEYWALDLNVFPERFIKHEKSKETSE